MRVRKQITGNKNVVGEKLMQRRLEIGLKQKDLLTQMQLRGIEMSSSALSKIEGRQRNVRDFELAAFCEILQLDASVLLDVHLK